jgi:hypothetical protein
MSISQNILKKPKYDNIHHYFITRFSICDINFKGFRMTRENEDETEYKSKLFSESRLDFKFNVFKKMTVPSILNQQKKNYTWLIYSSIYLPEKYKNELEIIAKKSNKIKLIYVDSFNTFMNDIDKQIKDKNYSTIRIDDDDGLIPVYLNLLEKYKNNHGSIISFPNGIIFMIDENQEIIYGKKKVFQNNAQGLVAINMNIYKCGNHMEINNKYNVIYDNFDDVYYMCCSDWCDTMRKFIQNKP